MILRLILGLLCAFSLFAQTPLPPPPLAHIVLLGDPHLPGKRFEQKETILQTINHWDDVTMVVALGDLCEKTGSQEEYEIVKNYFSKLKHPLKVITGNHDFIYDDIPDSQGQLKHASKEIQQQKLDFFKKSFGLEQLYYSIEQSPYLLIFLSADDPKHLAQISKEQIAWLKKTLEENSKKPTIIFFHAPLERTLDNYHKWINTPDFVAQPLEDIKSIILQNPQAILWASGHTHTSFERSRLLSTEYTFYEQAIFNLHNSDLNKEEIVTRSLLLYPDRIVIKAYNHAQNRWIEDTEPFLMLNNIHWQRRP